jgi:aerobic-type carbon monoxide dehydrogenase small subunit (CoxS/CutS family)
MELVINGRARSFAVEPDETLADTVRERLHLTGTKVACGRGECGACTVLVDDEPVYACLTLTIGCEGARVTTIEGLGDPGAGDAPPALHPVQRAFLEHDAVQCGFCTPGQILAVVALLARHPRPDDETIRRAMSGNLCRCGTYPRIAAAIRALAPETPPADG